MKKLNSKGFILAETLIVTVFLMVIFTMIYANFYPLVGEYEKRENYDDVDGKYTAYWVKKIIESNSYSLSTVDPQDISTMNKWGFIRFECSNVSEENNQREMCTNLVNALEISNCDSYGDGCDIFITRYTIGNEEGGMEPASFKETVRSRNVKRWNEVCASTAYPFDAARATETDSSCATVAFRECCRQKGLSTCTTPALTGNNIDYSLLYSDIAKTDENTKIAEYCNKRLTKKSFASSTKDYVLSLPNYTIPHTNTGAKYRVIVIANHKKDNNNYYSFSTMEVIK